MEIAISCLDNISKTKEDVKLKLEVSVFLTCIFTYIHNPPVVFCERALLSSRSVMEKLAGLIHECVSLHSSEASGQTNM